VTTVPTVTTIITCLEDGVWDVYDRGLIPLSSTGCWSLGKIFGFRPARGSTREKVKSPFTALVAVASLIFMCGRKPFRWWNAPC
jgi:hypothetical protein